MPNFSKIFLQGNTAFSRSNEERQHSRLSSILNLQIKDLEIKEFFLIKSKNILDKDKICEILNLFDIEILSPKILIIFCLIGLTPLILRYVFNYFFRK